MRIDKLSLAGLKGIEIPDGSTVGDEFELKVTIRLYSLERDKIDVSSYGEEMSYMDGELRAECLVIDQ